MVTSDHAHPMTMQIAFEVLRDTALAAFVLLGFISFQAWRKGQGEPAAWAASAFVSLGVVAIFGRILPDDPTGVGWQILFRLVLAAVLLFPWLVFRFATAFEPVSAAWARAALTLTAVVTVVGLAIPEYPQPGEPRPGYILAFTGLVLVQWTLLFATTAVRLWRGGAGQPTVARRRMRLLAFGATGMNVVIVVSGLTQPDEGTAVSLASQSLTLISAVGFGLGLGLPRLLRVLWRQPEQRAMLDGISELLTANNPRDVTATLLPNAAAIVGAPAAALTDRQGRTIATHPEHGDPIDRDRALSIPMRNGTLLIATGPYTPFFGAEEMNLLRSFGALGDLALERATLFEREQAFIANAAHELRTPLSVLAGLTATLHERWGVLPEDRLGEVLDAMNRQGQRATDLVNRLLDIAYVEHTGLELQPVTLSDAIDHAVTSAPPPEDKTVKVAVPQGLSVLAEPQRLEQVLTNLLTNAYRHGGTTIMIESRALPGWIEVTVEDDGPGIPDDIAPSLFEPFTRARTAKGTGSGLGLAIAARLAEAFGGSLSHDARASGARFVLHLRPG